MPQFVFGFYNRANQDLNSLNLKDRTNEYIAAVAKLSGSPVGTRPSDTGAGGASILYPSTDPLIKRGSSKRKDSYVVTQITLNYIIGNSIKCPVIR